MDCGTTMLTKFIEIDLELKNFSRELAAVKSDTECFPLNIRNKKRIFALITPTYHCTRDSSKGS